MNNTRQRRCVYAAVQACHEHPTAETIFSIAREKLPNISLGTVYRNLNVLSESGEIRRIEIPDSADRFDYLLTHHDHMICDQCGKVFDLFLEDTHALPEEITRETGMRVTGYTLVARCICPHCAKRLDDEAAQTAQQMTKQDANP